jgi:hypothetical protein
MAALFQLSVITDFELTKLKAKVRVKIKVTLRLAVYSQSIRLGVKPLETHDHSFFFN